MTRIYLGLLVLSFTALTACDNVARSYPTCAPGVSPAEFDCIPPTTVGEDTGSIDLGVGEPDTPTELDIGTTDAGPPDLGVCVPDCDRRECGGDGCGGVCGTCDRGEACSGGACVERGGGGDWDCTEIVECVQECRDEGCWQECISQGNPEGQDEFVAIIECLQEECSDVQDDPREYERCQNEQCGEQINECYGGGVGPGGDGDLECGEAIECMFGCDTEECQQECFFEGTPEAQDALQFLFQCPALEECGGTGSVDGWLECVQDGCPEEYGACFGGEPIEPPDPTDGCSDDEFNRLEEAGEEFGFILVECGFSCAGGREEVECAAECLGPMFDLGPACSDCVGEFAVCLAEDCGEFCGDPNSGECEECSDRFCVEPFFSCARDF